MTDDDLIILLLIAGPVLVGVGALGIPATLAYFHMSIFHDVERSINGYKTLHARQMSAVEIIAVAYPLFVWGLIKLRTKWPRPFASLFLRHRTDARKPGDGGCERVHE